MLRCKTCGAEIRFLDGTWAHAAKTKCRSLVIGWPEPLAVEAD